MKKMVLILIAGLILTAGTVLALDEDVKKTSDRVVEKLLDLTDRLGRRVTELEKTVEEQKKEIAQLKADRNKQELKRKQEASELLKRLPGQPVPKLFFTPDGTLVPQTPPHIWTPDGRQLIPLTPDRRQNTIPPGSVPGEINGMRFYITPVEAGTGPATPTGEQIPRATPVPPRRFIPAAE